MSSTKRTVHHVLETLNQRPGGRRNVLVRVDFNVPMTSNGQVADDARIRGALPTIAAILQQQYNVILLSHMGRPKLVQQAAAAKNDTTAATAQGDEEDEETRLQRQKLSLRPAAARLEQLLGNGTPVRFANDCVGPQASEAVDALPSAGGAVLLLENLRFHKEEEKNEQGFIESLAAFGDGYVNDAFGTCHRAHASVSGIPSVMDPSVCGIGLLVQDELAYLQFPPGGNVAAVVGGSKVSSKLPLIRELLEKVDVLVLGGGLVFTFLKASGVHVGSSMVEASMLDMSKEILADAKQRNKMIVLPVDAVCAEQFPNANGPPEPTQTFDVTTNSDGIEPGWMGLDVGPRSAEVIRDSLADADRIILNGPMGVFEIPPFDAGTRALLQVMVDRTKNGCTTVVGGGDSAAAVRAFDMEKEVSYVSTGGGATIELLAGAILPGVAAIGDV